MFNKLFFGVGKNTNSNLSQQVYNLLIIKKEIDINFINGNLTSREYIDKSMPIRYAIRNLTNKYEFHFQEIL